MDKNEIVKKLAGIPPDITSEDGTKIACFFCGSKIKVKHKSDCVWVHARAHYPGKRKMTIKRVVINLCEACLDGEGQECHTAGCALCFKNSPGVPIAPELYEVRNSWEETDSDKET